MKRIFFILFIILSAFITEAQHIRHNQLKTPNNQRSDSLMFFLPNSKFGFYHINGIKLTELDSTGFRITESQITDLGYSGIDTIYDADDPIFPLKNLYYRKNGVQYKVTQIPYLNRLISGGNVIWVNGLNFDVSLAAYFINSKYYATSDTTITLPSADPTNSRIDVIAVDTLGSVVSIQGIPSSVPIKPFVDPESQIELAQILLLAGDTIPYSIGGDSISTVVVYDENVEWTGSASNVTVDFNSTNFAQSGTVSANVDTIGNIDLIGFTDTVSHNISDYNTLSFYIKLKEQMPLNHALRLDLVQDSLITGLGPAVTLDKTSTDWQFVSVSISDFVKSDTIFNKVRFWYASYSSQTMIGFYIDKVILQGNIEQPTTIDLSNYWSKDEITIADTTRWGKDTNSSNELITSFSYSNDTITIIEAGVTHKIEVQQGSGGGITELTNEVTASGTGSVVATVSDNVIDYNNVDETLKSSVTDNDGDWDYSANGIIEATISANDTITFSNLQLNKQLKIHLTITNDAEIVWPSYVTKLGSSLSNGTFKIYVDCWNAGNGTEDLLINIISE